MLGSPPTMKFSEFIDLLLVRLYDLERQGGAGTLFDLNEIVRALSVNVPPQWVFDAGKVLESRGWAEVLFTFGGGCHARLTGEGRLYVEEERGTGIIKRYRAAPTQFINVSGTGNQVVVGHPGGVSQVSTIEGQRAPAFAVLEQLKHELSSDPDLTEADRADLLADVEMIGQQLRKREPNRAALAALLESLSNVTSVAGLVADLVRLFNA
jgi:hypothetical protein